MQIKTEQMILESVYRWEATKGDTVYMVQPLGGDAVREYTWKDTANEARRMAAYIKAQGHPAGSSIAILSKNCAEFIITELAIWMAGYVSVAIYPTLSADSVAYIIEHSEAKMLFVGKLDTWEDMKSGVPADMPCVAYDCAPKNDFTKWSEIISSTDPIAGSPVRARDELAMLVYTSGSTGKPKGVMHNFESIAIVVALFVESTKITGDDRQLSYLPLAHVFERAIVECSSLCIGSTVYFAESLDTFVQDLQRARPTFFHSVPRLWLKFQMGVFSKMPEEKLEGLLKIPVLSWLIKRKLLKGLGLEHCRMAVSGSAPIPPDVIRWYRKIGLELLEGYGMSENFCYSHFGTAGNSRIGYVGTAQAHVEHRITDEGEIQVKSPANMMGYFKQPEETAKSFTEDGFFKTGDRGELDEKGRLRITGRVKELFKTSKGKYVSPAPIENIINSDSHIEQSCVAGSGFPSCHAVVMLNEDLRAKINEAGVKEDVTKALAELISTVNSEVDPHEAIQFIVVAKDEWAVENEFLTPTMKIKRNVLEEHYEPCLDAWYKKKGVIWEA